MALRGVGAMLLLALVVALCMGVPSEAMLRRHFYRHSCPKAERIVNKVIRRALKKDAGLAADFVRMHFHDCFVRGCDASILLDSTPGNKAEKDSSINNPSLEGFDIVDKIKTKLEKACKGVVSCADIIAFAARDSLKLSKGLYYKVPAGRRDGRISHSAETDANVPHPEFNLTKLTQMFASKGMTQEEMVTLSGIHTIGIAHCTVINNRLYNFSATVSTDPSLDPAYAARLKKKCPKGTNDTSLTLNMDPPSPLVFDSSYYRGVLRGHGMFQSDQALLSSPATAAQVVLYAKHEALFKRRFAAAMVKMGQIGVLTGEKGEIRRKCSVVN